MKNIAYFLRMVHERQMCRLHHLAKTKPVLMKAGCLELFFQSSFQFILHSLVRNWMISLPHAHSPLFSISSHLYSYSTNLSSSLKICHLRHSVSPQVNAQGRLYAGRDCLHLANSLCEYFSNIFVLAVLQEIGQGRIMGSLNKGTNPNQKCYGRLLSGEET